MTGVPSGFDTKCRSLGFVNNPPRLYGRTVKTCYPRIIPAVTTLNDVCVRGTLQVDTIAPKSGSPDQVTIDGDLCVTGQFKGGDITVDTITVTDVCATNSVITDLIVAKTTGSPQTPVTVDGDTCVTGILEVDCIESKTLDRAYLSGQSIVAQGFLSTFDTMDTNIGLIVRLESGCNVSDVAYDGTGQYVVTLSTSVPVGSSRTVVATNAANDNDDPDNIAIVHAHFTTAAQNEILIWVKQHSVTVTADTNLPLGFFIVNNLNDRDTDVSFIVTECKVDGGIVT